jgi:hypothetical protein
MTSATVMSTAAAAALPRAQGPHPGVWPARARLALRARFARRAGLPPGNVPFRRVSLAVTSSWLLPATVPESSMSGRSGMPWQAHGARSLATRAFTSNSTNGAPVAITSPGRHAARITPEKGEGTSTTALAVSTANMG